MNAPINERKQRELEALARDTSTVDAVQRILNLLGPRFMTDAGAAYESAHGILRAIGFAEPERRIAKSRPRVAVENDRDAVPGIVLYAADRKANVDDGPILNLRSLKRVELLRALSRASAANPIAGPKLAQRAGYADAYQAILSIRKALPSLALLIGRSPSGYWLKAPLREVS